MWRVIEFQARLNYIYTHIQYTHTLVRWNDEIYHLQKKIFQTYIYIYTHTLYTHISKMNDEIYHLQKK